MRKTNVRTGGGQPLLSKGFTLIELLAVIVILAIIALIAVPIILNIIKGSKQSANIRSAEKYLGAIENAVIKENLNGEFNPIECTSISEDGKTLSCILSNGENKEIKVEIDGSVPTNKPTIVFVNGEIKKISNLEIEGETVTATSLKLTEYKNEPLCKASTKLTNGTGVLASEGNPYAYGVEYTCDLGDGNRTFYVLENINDNEVALILDRNIGEDVAWCDEVDKCQIDGEFNSKKGPITVMSYLNSLTENWSNKVTVSLPTYNQIDTVIKELGVTDYNYTCCGGSVNINSSYSNAFWSYDYLGQNSANSIVNPIDGVSSYWTTTPENGYSNSVYVVKNEGRLGTNNVNTPSSRIRPVITISKQLISQ